MNMLGNNPPQGAPMGLADVFTQAAPQAPPQQMAAGGAWGVQPYNDGYVSGERFGNTVYVNPVPTPEFFTWLSIAKKLNPGLNFVEQPWPRR